MIYHTIPLSIKHLQHIQNIWFTKIYSKLANISYHENNINI